MKTIGFAGTFYTLWDVQVRKEYVSEGKWYKKVICTYIKNLSKDRVEAFKKAETNNFSEDLKGKRKSFEYNTKIVVEPTEISERESLFQIILINRAENTLEVRKQALKRMIDLGYIIVKDNIYEVQGECRYEDLWYHDQLGINIKKII